MAELWRLVDRRRLIVTALCLVAWRALEQVPLFGVSPAWLRLLLESRSGTGFLNALGPNSVGLSPYSLVILGITPYINALVVMTFVLGLSARVRGLHRTTLERWTRALAMALALGSGYGFTVLLQSAGAIPTDGLTWFPRLVLCLEMAAGTMIMVLLAQAIDEHGLGFGNGAILIYALIPVANEFHRLAGLFADAPSVDALYGPIAVWALSSLLVAAATVAAVLAVRRVRGMRLRLLTAGVLRPQAIALAIITLPTFVSLQLAASYPSLREWILANWTPYGPNRWLDVGYVVLWASLVVASCVLIVLVDLRGQRIGRGVMSRILRMTVLGGCILAVCYAVVPVLEASATKAAGKTILVSGYDTVLVVAIVLGVIMTIEARRTARPVPIPIPPLP